MKQSRHGLKLRMWRRELAPALASGECDAYAQPHDEANAQCPQNGVTPTYSEGGGYAASLP